MIDDMSPTAIARMLGERLKQARLNANLSQSALAEKVGLSIKGVINAEKGKSQMETVIAILLGLNMTQQLDLFIPKPEISPIQLAKLQGKQRQRASGKTTPKTNEETPSW